MDYLSLWERIMKKKLIRYIIIYILFLFWNLVIQPFCYDEIWNYGFSYSIAKGFIPYLDFNMVVTPFSPFLYAIPLVIFGHNMLTLHIFNTFIILGIFIILEKLFEEKSYLLIALLLIPSRTITPGYNLLIFFLYLIIIFLEKNNKSDFFIGVILGLCVLTKQSVGIFLLLPSLTFIKKTSKIKKRFIGLIIPCIIFLIYLLITKSFSNFFDLCVFGLFDFATNNREKFKLFLFIYLIIIILIFRFIKLDKENIFNYYTLAFSTIAIPIFDLLHVYYALMGFIILLYLNNKITINFNNRLLFICLYTIIGFIFFKSNGSFDYPNDIHNFKYRTLNENFVEFSNSINNYMKKNDYNYIFLTREAYYFRIINEEEITYLDLINYGNQGFNGTNKLLKLIKEKEDNSIFFINKIELTNGSQTNIEALNYVINNAKKIKSIGVYDLYEFN